MIRSLLRSAEAAEAPERKSLIKNIIGEIVPSLKKEILEKKLHGIAGFSVRRGINIYDPVGCDK